MKDRKISNTLPPPTPKPKAPVKNIAGQFADLPFEEKVSAFKEIRANMRNEFEVVSKKHEERGNWIKEQYELLMR